MLTEKVIDIEASMELVNDEKVIWDLVKMLADSLDSMRSDMLVAYQESDWPCLARWVHKLHGAACCASAPRLRLAAGKLEELLNYDSKNHSSLAFCYEQLLQEMDTFLVVYRQLKLNFENKEG